MSPDRRPFSGARLWVARLALALLLPAVVFLALEGSLRLLGSGYPTTIALEVPGTDRYGINMRYGWRFFPSEIARGPLFFSFTRDKAPDVCRIVVLGASAAQGYPRGGMGLPRVLQVMLEEAFPRTRFEVINTAIVATNSHIVRDIAREFASYEPDLFLVYLGNNEVIGPYGLGASESGVAASLGAVRAGLEIKTTRTGQLLHRVIERFSGREEMMDQWGGMEMFAEHEVPLGDPALDRVMENFEANLRDVCRAGDEAGAAVVLSTVAVNVWDGAPFASVHRPDLFAADRETWDRHWDAGIAAEDPAVSLEAFDAASHLDDGHAELAWRRGNALLALGDTLEAGEAYRRAKELDVLRFRADDRINDVIRSVAGSPEFTNTELADAAATFAAAGPDLAEDPLDRRFYEHVHLTFAGNVALARAVWPSVVAALPAGVRGDGPAPDPLDRETCAERILHSDWEDLQALLVLNTLLEEPPFPQRVDQAEIVARWRRVTDDLKSRLGKPTLVALLPAYEAAVEADPHDFVQRTMYADLLRAVGDQASASRQWRIIEANQPPADWLE